MEEKSRVTRSVNDEIHSSDVKGDEKECESGLLEVSLTNVILRITKEIKWKVKVMLVEASLMNFILRISK